jgi:phospholipid/cholesterol/gamma-HCH transport system substrate-binding protein
VRRSLAGVWVGALVLVGVALTIVVMRFTSEHVGKEKGMVVWAAFTDARGLFDKTRVLSAGLQVGQIESRSLDPVTHKARVYIRIMPDRIKLYENAVIAKKVESLLGAYYLDVDPGTPLDTRTGKALRELKDGDQVGNVLEPTEMGDIINQVGATLPILREILRDVHDLTSGQIKDIADNVNDMIARNSVTLDRLLQRVDNIAATVEDVSETRADDIKITLRNVREITEGIKTLVGSSQGEVRDTGTQLRSSIGKLQASVDSLQHSLKNMEKATGKVADGEGTVGKLINDPTIANNVEQITEDASSFVHGVTRLQTIVGLRMEYNWLAGKFKEYVSIQLQPRPDKFYLFEVVDDPRGFREQRLENHESSALGNYSDAVVTTSQRLRISFQIGKCLGAVCGRFGLKESTGGLGVDVHLLDDMLTISADVFDTQSNSRPRVTARAMVNVYKRYVSLVAGIDDPLNFRPSAGAGGFFDWFFGAQLQFNDEDMKGLLLFGGSSLGAAAGSK